MFLRQHSKSEPCVEPIGIEPQRLLKTTKRLLILSQLAVRHSQVGVSFGEKSRIRSQPHRHLILRDGFRQLIVSLKISSKIAPAHRIFRIDARRRCEMTLRLLLFALENQRSAKIVFGDEVVLRDSQRVRPQSDAALPISNLS